MNATPLDGLLTTFKNTQMADSFHFQTCIACGAYNEPEIELKKVEDMNEDEQILFDMYKEIKKDLPTRKVVLKLFNLDGGYYFKCENCSKTN